jgi:epoxyqueuosine reductase QueG
MAEARFKVSEQRSSRDTGENTNLFSRLTMLAEFHAIDFLGVAGIAEHHQELEEFGGQLIHQYPRAISIGIVLQNTIVDLLEDREPYENVFQYKTHAYDVINNRLDIFSSIAASVIKKHGYRAMPVPAAERIDSKRVCASISHKAVARLAGFGWIGKSCLLITPQYGPRVRWTTILTDSPLEENQETMEEQCGSCAQCQQACPAQAIKGRNYREGEPRDQRLDVMKCGMYYKSMTDANQLPVCGVCLYTCPRGKSEIG